MATSSMWMAASPRRSDVAHRAHGGGGLRQVQCGRGAVTKAQYTVPGRRRPASAGKRRTDARRHPAIGRGSLAVARPCGCRTAQSCASDHRLFGLAAGLSRPNPRRCAGARCILPGAAT
jgi:hypothetical protein